MTHQRRFSNGFRSRVPSVDMCTPGAAVRQAEEAKREEDVRAPSDSFTSGVARTDVLPSGVPPVNISRGVRRWEPKKGLCGGSGRSLEEAPLVGCGWILGEFEWHSNQSCDGE
jgi:hypothetical protein